MGHTYLPSGTSDRLKTINNMKSLKEFIDESIPNIVKPMGSIVVGKLIELENINNSLNVLLGIELEIFVKLAEVREGRFYGKGIVDLIN